MSSDDVPTMEARGLSTQRQLDALNSAPKYFSKHHLRTARVSTGIDIEYVQHGTAFAASGESNSAQALPVDRVVLIMGFLQAKESWAAVIDLLLEKYSTQHHALRKNVEILAFDNRGVGGSSTPAWRYTTRQMAQDALALMDHVGWDAANIAGISMGGMISLELAAIAPERVQSLTLMVTTRGKYKADPRSSKPLRKSTFSKDPVVAVTSLLELLYPLDVIRSRHIAETGESVYDALFSFHNAKRLERIKPSLLGMVGQVLAIKTHFVSDERLRGIKKAGFPILIIGSMRDILIPPVESVTLKQRLDADHVDTLFFEHGGHGVTIQYIEEVTDGLAATFERASKL